MATKPESTHLNAAAFPSGLPGPALRALANAGLRSMAQVAARSEAQLAELHGVGPKTLQLLKAELARQGRSMRGG